MMSLMEEFFFNQSWEKFGEVPIILSSWFKDDSVCQNHSKCTKLIMSSNFSFCIFHMTDTNNAFDGGVLTSYHRSICEDPIILWFCVQRWLSVPENDHRIRREIKAWHWKSNRMFRLPWVPSPSQMGLHSSFVLFE